MKKKFLICCACLLVISCNKITDLNVDPKNPSTAPSYAFFTNAERNLSNALTAANRSLNIFRLIMQYWQQTISPNESNYILSISNVNEEVWNFLYRDVLRDFRECKNLMPFDVADTSVRKNQLAIADIMEVMTYYYLVTTYGNIPYTEALDIENPFPVYDDAKTIYNDLLRRLDVDIALMNIGFGSFGSADIIYGGDVSNWLKFANSFKLKMALTIADEDNIKAKAAAEEAMAAGVFTSNADNAEFHYLTSPPNTNPVWVNLVLNGSTPFVAASTIIDEMKFLNDPRLDNYFTEDANGDYSGGTPGANSNYAAFSKPDETITIPDFPALLLGYAEVEFLLAEAIERGYNVGGTAALHYNNAITASVMYWGGNTTEVAAYISQPSVNYSSATNYKHKIGIQKWIALYNKGWDAWIEWRRLDYPQLSPAIHAVSDIPVRYPYPVNEQNVNRTNYEQAAAAIGGDFVSTKLWWDIY